VVHNIIIISNHLVPDKKIMMIYDDERDVLQVFELALESKYNIILASSGEDCIDKFIEEKNRGNKIDLILLDYRLGDMFGDSVAHTIKQYNGTKIILISAYDLDSALAKELEENNHIANYRKKPIQLADPIELVADTIC
jgi:CheY-like chemotaxis protein